MPTTQEISGMKNVPAMRVDVVDAHNFAGPAGLTALNTDLLTGQVNGFAFVANFSSLCLTVVASGTITAGQIIVEGTNDTPIGNWDAITVQRVDAVGLTSSFSFGGADVMTLVIPLSTQFIRVRISTAFAGGGSIRAFGMYSRIPATPTIVQVTGAVTTPNNIFWNDSLTTLAASGVFTGTGRDAGAPQAQGHARAAFNAFAVADQAGTMRIQLSNDNSVWRDATTNVAVAANTPVHLSVPVMTRWYRVLFTNGAAAQGSFMLNTSFTMA